MKKCVTYVSGIKCKPCPKKYTVIKGSYPSGQRGQTVNLLAPAFSGSNPLLPNYPSSKSADLP